MISHKFDNYMRIKDSCWTAKFPIKPDYFLRGEFRVRWLEEGEVRVRMLHVTVEF
jgi:hypothetical protein